MSSTTERIVLGSGELFYMEHTDELPYKKHATTYINSEHLFQTRFELSFTDKDEPRFDWEPESIYDF